MVRAGAIVALTVPIAGCLSTPGPSSDPLATESGVALWAITASAIGVLAGNHMPILVAGGAATFDDPACPIVTEEGDTLIVTGGCTDSRGVAWSGFARVERGEAGSLQAIYEGFGEARFGPKLTTGTAEIDELDVDVHAFALDFVREGTDSEITIHYEGEVTGATGIPVVASGTGRFELSQGGGTEVVEAATVDEVTDGAICGTPLSGTTTMVSAEHTAVITYDGATDCDDMAAARWSLDGEDQGLLEGVTCSVAGGGGGLAAGTTLWLLVLAISRPRRSRRATAPAGRRAGTRRFPGWPGSAPCRPRAAASSRAASAPPPTAGPRRS